jgi:hypothetical protein
MALPTVHLFELATDREIGRLARVCYGTRASAAPG